MDSQDQIKDRYIFYTSYGYGYLHIDENRCFTFDKSTIEMLKSNNDGSTGIWKLFNTFGAFFIRYFDQDSGELSLSCPIPEYRLFIYNT